MKIWASVVAEIIKNQHVAANGKISFLYIAE